MNKTILRTLMTFALAGTLVFAQGGQRKKGNQMTNDLGLNEDQKTQVQSIMKEQRAAVAEAHKNNASKEQIQQIRKQSHDKLAGVLNQEQMQKFDQRAKAAKKRHKKG